MAKAEETAAIFSRLQDRGIETIGMLDLPPESDQANYEVRGRRDLVAAQLLREQATWQPLLEPVMTRIPRNRVYCALTGARMSYYDPGEPPLD